MGDFSDGSLNYLGSVRVSGHKYDNDRILR